MSFLSSFVWSPPHTQQQDREDEEEDERRQKWALCRVAQFGILGALNKWVECAAAIGPGVASGVRALNQQREYRRHDGQRWIRLATVVSRAR